MYIIEVNSILNDKPFCDHIEAKSDREAIRIFKSRYPEARQIKVGQTIKDVSPRTYNFGLNSSNYIH